MKIFSFLNKHILDFKNNDLNNEYEKYFCERFLPQIKLAILFSAIFYGIFSYLDHLLYPSISLYLIFIRVIVVLTFLSAFFIIEKSCSNINIISIILIFLASFGIIEMIRYLHYHHYGNNIYFAGLMLITIFSYAFYRIKFSLAIITAIIIIFGFNIVSWQYLESKELISKNFFLISDNLIGLIFSYIININDKKFFLLYKKLQDEKSILYRDKRKFERLAHIDPLTGLANKRYFFENLKYQWKTHFKKDYLSILMIDIDFFKKYNDLYGHIEGDKCLKIIANTIKNQIRLPKDMVGRFGGEEFLVLLPKTKKEVAVKIAERIRKKIESLKISHLNSQTGNIVTISIGVASMIPEDEDLEKIVLNADTALYNAKKSGRNKVVFFQ